MKGSHFNHRHLKKLAKNSKNDCLQKLTIRSLSEIWLSIIPFELMFGAGLQTPPNRPTEGLLFHFCSGDSRELEMPTYQNPT